MLTVLGTIGVVAVFVVVGLWADRHVALLPRPEELAAPPDAPPRALHAPGTAPETALAVDDAAGARALAREVRRVRCCRTRMRREPDDEVRYDGRVLTVLRFRCARCGARRRLYVAPASPPSPA